MKQDKLEKFISENRELFDDELPGSGVWENISADIQPQRGIGWKSILWKAAAAVIIFTASWFFHDLIDSSPSEITTAHKEAMDSESKEKRNALLEAEAYYTSRIGNTREKVYKLARDNRQLLKELNEEFVELDRIMKDLKRDLQDNAANEEVVEAMIQNYRVKLLILEEVLQQLQKSHNDEKEPDHEVRI